MHTRTPLAAAATACIATTAIAQDYHWIISDTGDADGIIEPGEEALIDLEVAWGEPGVAFAMSWFDVIGIEGWVDGEVLSAELWYCGGDLSAAPIIADNNDILEISNFQLPGMFNCGCCGDQMNPTPQLHLIWRPSSYFHREVTIVPVNFWDYWDGGTGQPDTIRIYTDPWSSTMALEAVVEALTFVIDCPADIIQDGQLDTTDFFAYLELYLDRKTDADFNEDGRIDTRDLIAFLNAWATGC